MKTQFKRHSTATQRGVSIISVLLGLVIGAGVLAVAFNQFQDAQRKSRIEAANSEIATMIAEAQKLYGTSNQYGAVTTAIAVQGGVVPDRLRVAGTNTAQNRYNGAITFAPATITTANDSLALGYARVSSIDCQDLILTADPLTRRIEVAGTVVKPADGAVNIGTMSAQCDSADAVDVTFVFGRS